MKRFLLVVKAVISVGILAWIFSKIPFENILSSLSTANWSIYLLVTPIALSLVLFSAFQVKVYTDNHEMNLSTRKIVEINLATHFYNLFLPGYLAGGAIRWYKLFQNNNKKAEALAVLVFNRIFYTFILFVIGGIACSFEDPEFRNDYWLVLFWIASLIFGGIYFLGISSRLATITSPFLKLDKDNFFSRAVVKHLQKLIQAGLEFRKLTRKEHLKILFHCSLQHILSCLGYYIIARSLSLDISFVSLCWIRSFVSIAVMAPFSISGFGIREGSLILLLGIFAVPPEVAVAFSFLHFSSSFAPSLIGGGLEARAFFSRKISA